MACGNNHVSRDYLSSQPTSVSQQIGRLAVNATEGKNQGRGLQRLSLLGDVLGRTALDAVQSQDARFDTAHIFAPHEKNGKFVGGHHLDGSENNVNVTDAVIDVKSGSAAFEMTVTSPEGTELSKENTHTVFNPALSQSQVLDEISSAISNATKSTQQTNGNTRTVGVSQNGVEIVAVTDPNGRVVTAYPVVSDKLVDKLGSEVYSEE